MSDEQRGGPVWVDHHYVARLREQVIREQRVFNGTPIGDLLAEWGLALVGVVDVLQTQEEALKKPTPTPTLSAEQLSIALMAEARRLNSMTLGLLDQMATADRLVVWANEARKLGVASQQRYEAIEKVRELLVSVKNSSDPVLWMNTLEEMAEVLDV